jgi:ClpX C4-type zinc finger
MTRTPPPPVIDSARVVSYAFVEDIPYRKWGALYVGDELVEAVPCLAICINLGKDIGPLIFHCNTQWNTRGTSGAETVEAAKERMEKNYPGVSARWVDVNTSVEDALKYYDEQSGNLKCSFCGKRPFELEGWVEGTNAVICRACVDTYYRAIHEGQSGDQSSME